MLVEIHLLNWLIWFVGGCLIWAILPEDYTEEIGSLIGMFILIIWTIACITFFYFNPDFHLHINLIL
jgi:hypothetical protein